MKRLTIKASAGTGKTFRLSLEYILSLIDGIPFEEILVMTFTKKATAEIKEKIFERLEDLLSDNEEKRLNIVNILENLNTNIRINDEVLNNLRNTYKKMKLNKNKINIYTIDAFTNIIFKNIVAPIMNLSTFNIINEKENDEYIKYVLLNILNNKKHFELFKTFIENESYRDLNEYKKSIENIIYNRWQYSLIKDKKNLIDKQFLENESDFLEELHNAISFLEKCFVDLKKDVSKENFCKSLIVKNLLGKSIEEQKKFCFDNYREVIKIAKFYDGRKTRAIKDAKKDELDKLNQNFLTAFAKDVYNKEVIPYEKAIIKILNNVYNLYDERKLKEGKFTFNDISYYVYEYLFNQKYKLLDSYGVSDLFFDLLDMKINTIFIDEFQDTSILQWKILHEIIKKSENVICVGDEKQSIYGWRGGEKKLFENLDTILKSEIQNLDTSYRSDINIVKVTNSIFKEISNLNDKWKFIESKVQSKKDGFVNIFEIENFKDKQYLDLIIKHLKDNFSNNYNNIAIIARTNKVLNEVASYLIDNDIDYNLSSDVDIRESFGVKELIFLLDFLNTRKYINFLEFISSKIFNLDFSFIKILTINKKYIENFLFNEDYRIENLNVDENILLILENIKSIINKYDTYDRLNDEEIINDIFLIFPIINNLTTNDELKNLFSIFTLIKEYKYISKFLDYIHSEEFDEKIYTKDENNKINLISIHKSKGLQYDTVYYINKLSNKSDFGSAFYFNMNEDFSDINFSLFTHTKYKEIIKNALDNNIIESYEEKEELEEINNLYVAITRAKHNLIIINDKNNSILNNTSSLELGSLYLNNQGILEEKKNVEIIEKEEGFKNYFFDKNENNELTTEVNTSKFNLSTERKRMIGILIHYFLENLKNLSDDEIEFAKKLCLNKYYINFGDKIIEKIFSEENLIKIKKEISFLFDEKWTNTFNEFKIFDKNSNVFRLDKVLIRKNNDIIEEILIVDYKTGEHNEEQLENYKNILKENFKEAKIYTKYIELDIKI